MPKLTALALIEINISDAAAAKIASMGRLKLLDLRACPRITNVGLAGVASMKSLRTLRLRGYNINDKTLAIAGKLTSLTGLTLDDAGISDAWMSQLKRLPLEDFSLFRCYSVTDNGLACLQNFTNLRLLTLRDMPLMGTCLAGLRGKKKLATLVLSETGVSDESLQNLVGLDSLARLELRQVLVRDVGMETIATLKNLRRLDLDNTRITNRPSSDPKHPKGLACLAALPRLEHLSLKLCVEVTDDVVPLLGRLKGLRTLSVTQSGISSEGVKRLSEMLPNCRIDRP